MSTNDTIEFYDGDKIVISVRSTMVPPEGSKISIRKQTWTVRRVTYAVDYAADYIQQRSMRANVDLEPDE